MSNVLNVFAVFILFMACLFVGVYAISELHAANTVGCVINGSGSLVNCSLSDYAFIQENRSVSSAGMLFNTGSYLLFILVVSLFITCLIFGGLLMRGR
jgi:hypothetical protein